MDNKKLVTILIIVAVVIFTGFGLWRVLGKQSNSSSNTGSSQQTGGTTSSSNNQQDSQTTYTAGEVATHDKGSDCWTIINGNVYNITSYVPMHPGGDEILRACGVDGTTLFTERTTSDGQTVGSGTPHDSQAQRQLAQYQIGVLSQ